MEFLLNRYRNLTVLLIVITAQLVLIAYQVKSSNEVPLLRIWAVTAVTSVERVLEFARRNTWGFVEDYFVLVHTHEQNEQLKKQVGDLKLQNQFLKTELQTADRAKAMTLFQARTPSKTIGARIVGNGTGANSKAVFVDRGSAAGVESGMAVVTPDGIVGKVVAAYPDASLVLLVTDSNFAAGVVSQNGRVHGTLKGQGHDGTVLVDYIPNEEKIVAGEWFFTSGDDRIFPKGFPVGQVTAVKNGAKIKEIDLNPSGFQGGLDEVLIVLDAVHQAIPDVESASSKIMIAPAPPPDTGAASADSQPGAVVTEADRLKQVYREAAEEQHHVFGANLYGTPPDFTKLPGRDGSVPRETKPVPTPSSAAAQAAGTESTAVRQTPAGDAKTDPAVAPVRKPKAADPVATDSDTSVKPKPKRSAPLLVTDPTDADPSEPVVPASPPPPAKKAEAKPKVQNLQEP